MNKFLFSFLFFLSFTAPLLAAPGLSLEVNPSAIGTNENALVTLTVQGDRPLDIPTAPSSDAFTLRFSGQGTVRKASIINGSVTIKTIYNYTYVLMPNKTGTHAIPGFLVRTREGEFYSSAASIVVRPQGAARAPRRQRVFNPFEIYEEDPGNPFLHFIFSRTYPVQNTPFIADLYIFSENYNFLEGLDFQRDLRLVYTYPFRGGVVHEIKDFPDQNITVNFNGVEVGGRLFRRFVVYPLSPQRMTLVPPHYYGVGGLIPYELKGESVEVPVTPAPKGLGYVGQELNLSLELSGKEVQAGKDLTLTLTIEGDGNTDYFADPFSTAKIDGLFVSQPRTELEVTIADEQENRIRMKKIFSYTLSPRTEGRYVLPPIVLPYSTPQGEEASAGTEEQTLTAFPAPQEVSASAELRPLPVPSGDYFYGTGYGWLLGAWLLGSALMLWAGRKASRRRRFESDEVFARREGAKNRLEGVLRETEFALNAGKLKEGARLLRQSLLGYAADKKGLPAATTPHDVAVHLGPSLGEAFLRLIDELTEAAFGPPPQEKRLKVLLNRAQDILAALDKA